MNKEQKIPDNYIFEYREKIGKIIRELRENKNYSQDDLAGIMGVHRSTLSKIESGKFAITIDYLAKFSWYLDFEISLVGNEDV